MNMQQEAREVMNQMEEALPGVVKSHIVIINPYRVPNADQLAARRKRNQREDLMLTYYSSFLGFVFVALAIACGAWVAHHLHAMLAYLAGKL
jgi:hypothetical protein